MSTTTTAIELQSPENVAEERQSRTTTAHPVTISASGTDEVMQESLLVDSQVPEGGYSWVVIFACAVITFWFVGTTYCWGVLQAALVEQGVSSPSTLAFVGSLTTGCISFLAVLNARVIRKLGARTTGLLGVFLLGLGEELSGFTTRNVGGLFTTVGVVMGVGVR